MRRKPTGPRRWEFRYLRGVVIVDEEIELIDGSEVVVVPTKDLFDSVSETMAAKFGDHQVEGSFDATGMIEVRFNTEVEAA